MNVWMTISIVLFVLLIASVTLTVLFARTGLSYETKLFETYQEMSESLNSLQLTFENVKKKSKLEIMVDEPVVRELIADIKTTKQILENIISKIENSLSQRTGN